MKDGTRGIERILKRIERRVRCLDQQCSVACKAAHLDERVGSLTDGHSDVVTQPLSRGYQLRRMIYEVGQQVVHLRDVKACAARGDLREVILKPLAQVGRFLHGGDSYLVKGPILLYRVRPCIERVGNLPHGLSRARCAYLEVRAGDSALNEVLVILKRLHGLFVCVVYRDVYIRDGRVGEGGTAYRIEKLFEL